MIFQVTGLPRSGTAFIASFLNLHQLCFCHHDLAADRDDWKEHSDELAISWPFVGEVSTYGWLPRAQRDNVVAPRVAIFRDPEDSHAALKRIMGERVGGVDPFIKASSALREWAHKVDALCVPFDELHTVPALQQIWKHIFKAELGVPFPVEKAQQMITMNVQRNKPQEAFGDARLLRQRLLTPWPQVGSH